MTQLIWYEIKKVMANRRTRLLLAVLAVLNLLIGITVLYGGDREILIKKVERRQIEQALASGEMNYETLLEDEERAAEELQNYCQDISSAADREAVLRRAVLLGEYKSQLIYFEEYATYLGEISTRAQAMQEVSIWKDTSSYSNRNIRKTAADFSNLIPDLQIGSGEGIEQLGSCFWTDCLLLLFVLFLGSCVWKWEKENRALVLVQTCRHGTWKLAWAKLIAVFLFGMFFYLLLYGSDYILCLFLYGYGNPERSIQSLQSFRNCCFSMTTGEYLAVFLIAKWLAFMGIMMAFCVLLLVLDGLFIPVCVLLAVLTGEYLLYVRIGEHSAMRILRSFNMFAFLDTCELIRNYRNFNLFGYPVSRTALWQGMAGILGIVFPVMLPFLFVRSQKRGNGRKPRFERLYRLRETVYRKTPAVFLKGHLLWELTIGLKKAGGILILLIFLCFIWMLSNEEKEWYLIPAEEASYETWIAQYGGEMTPQNREEIEEWRQRFDTADEQMAEWESQYEGGEMTAGQLEGKQWELSRDLERQEGFEVFYEQYQAVGRQYGIVSRSSFTCLFEGSRIRSTILIITVFGAAVLSAVMLTREYQRNTLVLLRSTGSAAGLYKGRTLCLLFLIGILSVFRCLCQYLEWSRRFDFSSWNLCVKSVPQLSQTVFPGSIGSYLLLLCLLQCLGMMAIGVLMLSASVALRQFQKVVTVSAMFALSYAFEEFNIGNPITNLLNRVLDMEWVLLEGGSLRRQLTGVFLLLLVSFIIWRIAEKEFCGTLNLHQRRIRP